MNDPIKSKHEKMWAELKEAMTLFQDYENILLMADIELNHDDQRKIL